jgi:hypothetical protein
VTVKPLPFAMSAVVASPAILWPPNRRLADVALRYLTSGGCGGATCVVTSITSSQPVTGQGDPSSPDWFIIDDHTVKLRAESVGRDWRIYTITVQCHDGSGQTQARTVTVKVGRDVDGN